MIVMPKKKDEVAVEAVAPVEPVVEIAAEKVIEAAAPAAQEIPAEIPKRYEPSPLDNWTPKSKLGRDVFEGKINKIDDLLKGGRKILESEIVDKLMPGIKNELVLVGGRAGKGGGVQRIPVRITAAAHKSGRRFHT